MLADQLTVSYLTPQQALKDIFGYQSFREGQSEVIETILAGNDVLAVMPTGGGKSLCYQIPAITSHGVALVISPLISLMKDQVDQLKANGIQAAYLNSTQTREQQSAVWAACRRGCCKLVYLSPEKVMTEETLWQLSKCQLSLIAIDEAHCISQWGHDFRLEYRDLGRLREGFPTVPLMALTATADQLTRQDIIRLLNMRSPLIHISSFDRPNIRYSILEKMNPLAQVIHLLTNHPDKSGIIYCNSRSRVTEIAAKLQEKGINAAPYHAGLPLAMRESVQERFQRDDIDVVVATVAFGMGINKLDVRFVIHYDLPRSIESYYQETGRAGRDGLPADAWLLYDISDMMRLRHWIKEKDADEIQQIELTKLTEMNHFAQASTCRRLILLNYFGQLSQKPCQNCDVCLDPPVQYDGLQDAQKILSTIYRVGQRFGATYVVEVLRGSDNSRVNQYGHQKLSVYGLGKEKTNEHWLFVIRQLIHLGLIEQDFSARGILRLTEAARPYLRGECELNLAVPRKAIYNKRSSTRMNSVFDTTLFERLRRLRKSLADDEDIPPYIIFNDATLVEMAEKMPINSHDMLNISGVGQKKLAQFGYLFMAEINAYLFERDR